MVGLASPTQTVPSVPLTESLTFTHLSMLFAVNTTAPVVKSVSPAARCTLLFVCSAHVIATLLNTSPDGRPLREHVYGKVFVPGFATVPAGIVKPPDVSTLQVAPGSVSV